MYKRDSDLAAAICDANETAGEENPLHVIEAQREREWAAVQTILKPHMDAIHAHVILALNSVLSREDFAAVIDFIEDEGHQALYGALARARE